MVVYSWQSDTNDAEHFSKPEKSETKEMCPIDVQCARHLCLHDLCQLILSVRYLMHSISDMSRTSEKSHHKALMALRGCKFQLDGKGGLGLLWAAEVVVRSSVYKLNDLRRAVVVTKPSLYLYSSWRGRRWRVHMAPETNRPIQR